MTPIGQTCMCEPVTWLYFVFGQSVFVFVGQTLTAGADVTTGSETAAASLGFRVQGLGFSEPMMIGSVEVNGVTRPRSVLQQMQKAVDYHRALEEALKRREVGRRCKLLISPDP